MGALAESLPWAHHVNTSLICKLGGGIMNENNPPMAMPNGYVYSLIALTEMAEKNDGKLRCPRTGNIYVMPQLKRLYIA